MIAEKFIYQQCKCCKKEFRVRNRTARDKYLYCSIKCWNKYSAYKSIKRQLKLDLVVYKDCKVCGKNYKPRAGGADTCSVECSNIKAARRYELKKSKERNQNKTCKICGKEFLANYKSKIYCSKKCYKKEYHKTITYKTTKKSQRHKRKMIKRGCYIEPVSLRYVYDKCNGKCMICGNDVNIELYHNDNMAATIDHIIPISKGGLHSKTNCQLAHRHCNSIKNNKLNFIYSCN